MDKKRYWSEGTHDTSIPADLNRLGNIRKSST